MGAMRRALLACSISLVSAVPAVAATPTDPPRASLEAFACQRAANQLDRAIQVTAVMRPMTGTQRMQMKFVLLKRRNGAALSTPVQGRDLGIWLDPNPATLGQRPNDVWRLKKVVANLAGGSGYRLRVTLRWIGSSATVLSHTVLFTPLCTQP
jgi:hypothetical protein